jgi:hypothetical protein
MVKFNWEDEILIELGVKRPKRFRIEARKQIKENTLNYIQRYGRVKWVPTSEIFGETIKRTDLYKSPEGNFFFASQGVKSKINSVVHLLRLEGHPIISGIRRGYRYADENCDDCIRAWDERFSAWDKKGTDLIHEFKNDEELITRVIEKLIVKKREEEAKELQKILIKYKKKVKELEEIKEE